MSNYWKELSQQTDTDISIEKDIEQLKLRRAFEYVATRVAFAAERNQALEQFDPEDNGTPRRVQIMEESEAIYSEFDWEAVREQVQSLSEEKNLNELLKAFCQVHLPPEVRKGLESKGFDPDAINTPAQAKAALLALYDYSNEQARANTEQELCEYDQEGNDVPDYA